MSSLGGVSSRARRVCHVCSAHRSDDPRVFAKECVSLAEAGYEVHLIAQDEGEREYGSRGVIIHPAPKFRSRWGRICRRGVVAQMAASLSPELYHVHEPELLAPIVRRAAGRPVVWDVHEPYVEKILGKQWIPALLRGLVRYLWDRRERRLLPRCAAVVPATMWMCERYRSIHPEVVDISNLPLLPADLPDLPADRDRRRLVFTGIIDDVESLLNVLRAMAILASRGIRVFLEMAGGVSYKEVLDQLLSEAERLGVRGNVRHRGRMPREDALKLQRECGIGIVIELPNAGTAAGFPTKMPEYMLAGLPLVYSSLPTFHWVAAEADAGIAVDPHDPLQIADAIQRLVADPVLADRLGKNGRSAVIERLNWNGDRVKLLALYSRILSPPAARIEEGRHADVAAPVGPRTPRR